MKIDLNTNTLIKGENLEVLKMLEEQLLGEVKCIYIDPPYNTRKSFHHYKDSQKSQDWLNMMKERLLILQRLLRVDGTIWISIDDDECHYLKVLCDEIFGRKNFIANVIWEKKHTRSNDAKYFSDTHDHILCYAKCQDSLNLRLLPRTEEVINEYSNPDNDPRGPWASGPCHAKRQTAKDIYKILTPSGRSVLPPQGTSWRFSRTRFQELIEDNRIYFGRTGSNVPRYKRFISEVQNGLVPKTLWERGEVGDNQEAKKEVKEFNSRDVFSTPKPERLIERILYLATDEGDLVLDCFAGSGTTGAVAHKMKRKWIMIEMGAHAETHIIPRLKKVISGEDQGGVSKICHWNGGGSYDYRHD